jgi:hypothetical protein
MFPLNNSITASLNSNSFFLETEDVCHFSVLNKKLKNKFL